MKIQGKQLEVTLAEVLANGQTTGGTSIIVMDVDSISGEAATGLDDAG